MLTFIGILIWAIWFPVRYDSPFNLFYDLPHDKSRILGEFKFRYSVGIHDGHLFYSIPNMSF